MAATPAPAADPDTTAAAVRRNTWLLAVAQGLLYTSAPIVLAVGGPAAAELSGREGGVGLMIAVYFLAAAVAAPLAGRWMDRHGRRPGLLFGHVLVLVGALVAAAAVNARSMTGLMVAATVVGAGAGTALLGRGAVADMHPPERRARAVGMMLAASTVGAVGGAPLAALVQTLSDGFGFDRMVTPWLLVPLFEVAAIYAVVAVRPDPRDLAVGRASLDEIASPAATLSRRTRRQLLASPPFRAALVAAAVAQAAMVAVMGVTPVVVHSHGGGDLAVSTVLSFHFLGMFALMPLIGAALDRWGRRRGLLAAAAVCLFGVPVGALGTATVFTAVAMFCAGVGWAGAYLASTAVVSDVTSPMERAGALGLTDLLVSLCSAAGGVIGGVLLELGGFPLVTVAAGLLFIPVVTLVFPLREPEPGRWVVAAAAS